MEGRIVFVFLLMITLIACSEKEDIGLYNEIFKDESDHWEVSLHLRELSEDWKPEDGTPYEEDVLTIGYLKEIDEELKMHYEMIYGKPAKLITEPGEDIFLTEDKKEYTTTQYQQRMIEEVCFGTLTLKLQWENDEGEDLEENFTFKDQNNPQCEHIVLMAPRGDVN